MLGQNIMAEGPGGEKLMAKKQTWGSSNGPGQGTADKDMSPETYFLQSALLKFPEPPKIVKLVRT